MKFFKKWRSKPETKGHVHNYEHPVAGSLGELLGITSYMTHVQAFRFYKDCQAVSTVIDGIAEAVADLPIYLEVDKKVETEHEILDLLMNPHPDYTGKLFLTAITTHYLLTGECYTFAGGNYRFPPRYLAPISPANISTIQGSDGFTSSYQISGMMYSGMYSRTKVNNRWVYLDGAQKLVKQIRRFSTHDNSQLNGESKLISAVADVRQNLAGSNHNLTTLTKGGRLSLLFSIKDDMDAIRFQDAKNEIISRYSGSSGASVAVVKGDQIDVQEMGNSNRDMDFANLQSMTEKAVAKRYKYPLQLISDDSSTFNNLNTAYQALYDNCVIPVAKEIFDGLGHMLLERYGLDPSKARIAVDETAIPSIAERMADIAVKRRNSYSWTENEIRQEQGLDPVTDGDVIYRPANLVTDEEPTEEETVTPTPLASPDE